MDSTKTYIWDEMIISSSIMKDSQVGDSSCLEKLKVSCGPKEISAIKGTLYTLIGSLAYCRCTTVSKLNKPSISQNSFFIKKILETNIKLWLIGMLKNLEGILSEIHKK